MSTAGGKVVENGIGFDRLVLLAADQLPDASELTDANRGYATLRQQPGIT